MPTQYTGTTKYSGVITTPKTHMGQESQHETEGGPALLGRQTRVHSESNTHTRGSTTSNSPGTRGSGFRAGGTRKICAWRQSPVEGTSAEGRHVEERPRLYNSKRRRSDQVCEKRTPAGGTSAHAEGGLTRRSSRGRRHQSRTGDCGARRGYRRQRKNGMDRPQQTTAVRA